MAQTTTRYGAQLLDQAKRWAEQIDGWQAELGRASFPADQLVRINRGLHEGQDLVAAAVAIADEVLPLLRVDTRRPALAVSDVEAVQQALRDAIAAAFAAIPKTAEGRPAYQDFDADGRVVVAQSSGQDAAALSGQLSALRTALAPFLPAALPAPARRP